MKRIIIFAICLLALVGSAIATPVTEEQASSVTVYAYDSFLGEWGAGESIAKAFEEKTGIKVNLVGCNGASELVQRIAYEGKDCPADIALGISDSMLVDTSLFASDLDAFSGYDIDQGCLIPFDWGVFAFEADTQKIQSMPKSLEDLAKPEYKGEFILIDPRTSSVGLGLLLWTIDAFGPDGYLSWWRSVKDNALTIADSWSSAYGLFTEGEAPLVITYTTSPVYHVMWEDTTRYQALEFTNGHIKTTEYCAILKSSRNRANAELFVQFLLNEGQESLAVANTMFPVNETVELPPAFDYALRPSRIVSFDRQKIVDNLDKWIADWEKIW